jgi:hypothetical protein
MALILLDDTAGYPHARVVMGTVGDLLSIRVMGGETDSQAAAITNNVIGREDMPPMAIDQAPRAPVAIGANPGRRPQGPLKNSGRVS